MSKILVPIRQSYVCPQDTSRSLRERVLIPLQAGKYFDIICCPENTPLENLPEFDIVYLSRGKSKEIFHLVEFCTQHKKKIFYDLDDLVTQFPENNIAGWSAQDIERALTIMKRADIVVCANKNIESFLHNYGVSKTFVLPTGIDITYPHRLTSNSKKFVWVNGDNLKFQVFKNDFFAAINEFLKIHSGYEMHIYADTDAEFKGKIPYVYHSSVSHKEFLSTLWEQKFDFAICPLGGSEEKNIDFYNCKTPIKYLIYGALSIPCVYSDTQIYNNVISDERTALLASNKKDEWLRCLRTLATNSPLRNNLSSNAYEDVKENFNITKIAKIQNEMIQRTYHG